MSVKKEENIFDYFRLPEFEIFVSSHGGLKPMTFKRSEITPLSNDGFKTTEVYRKYLPDCDSSIDLKEDQKEFIITDKVKYRRTNYQTTVLAIWERIVSESAKEETGNVKTCMDVFKELGSYKLIETEAEFEDYLNSNVSSDDWSMCKLAETMLSLNLGQGFINGFADLIGTDLQRYHEMIDLSKECESRDILMYLLVKKYGGKD